MKKTYPDYARGSTEQMYKRLKGEDKKTFDNFIQTCRATCSEKREKKLKMLILQARDIIQKPLNKLTKENVLAFLSAVNRSNRKPYTKNDIKKIFKRFIKWYYKDLEMIEGEDALKDAFKGVSKKRAFNYEKINKGTLLKPEELEKLLRAANSLKWKAILSLMYESAMRPCEMNLKWKQLEFDDNLGICRVHIYSSPKTKDKRDIPVKDCVVHLKRWREEYQFPNRTDNDYVFPAQHKRDKPMGDGVISQMLKRLCKKAKIRPMFSYLFRHSRLWEIQKKCPEKIAAKFGGHGIDTSELYNHISDDDVEESILQQFYAVKEITEEEKVDIEKVRKEMKELKEDINKKLNLIQEDTIKIFNKQILKKKGLMIKRK